MITSIEPGVYRPGQWGVRIENLVMNVPAPRPKATAFAEMLEFETLTLCPIDTRCIERSLLRADEIAWLNAYHATVRERLAPLVRRRRAGLAAERRCRSRSERHDADGHALGIDLGGTKIEAMLLSAAGQRALASAHRHAGRRLRRHAARHRRAGGAGARRRRRRPCSVGLGTPGSLTPEGLMKNANSQCLNGRPLRADLRARCWASRCASPTTPTAWRCPKPPTAPAPAPRWCSP